MGQLRHALLGRGQGGQLRREGGRAEDRTTESGLISAARLVKFWAYLVSGCIDDGRFGLGLTLESVLDSILDGHLENVALSPHVNNSSNSLLHVGGGALIGSSYSLGNSGRNGNKEFLLITCLGLLGDLCSNGVSKQRP